MKINLTLLILAMTIFMALGTVQQKKREGNVPPKSLTDTTDSVGRCGTAERDSVEFENLPYYDNNDYLEALLDSLGYPPDQTLNRNGGISPMSYSNYPTRYWIPVKFWIIRNSSGGQGATENEIKQMLQSVNDDFRNNNTLIQFYQKCDISYIDNNAYLDLSDSEARSLARNNEDAGAVNVFLGHVLDGNAGGIHYANGPISFDPYKAIFLSRPAYQWAYNVMTHELGHYFDLDHTHQFNDKGRCRREPVSRTRRYALISLCKPIGSRIMCESTGDALRDTPADPDLRNNGSCNSYNLGGLDHFGDAYSDNPPSLSNFMSYNSSACRSTFTRLQVAVMLNAIERNMLHISNRIAWSNEASMFDTYEPDNSAATAGDITRCEVQERNFHMQRNSGVSFSSCDADWIIYVAPLNETIDIYTSAVSGRATVNTSLFVYDSSNNLIVSNDDKASGDIYSRVSLTTTASSTYFIKIVNNSSTSGGFYKLGIGLDIAEISISGPSALCDEATYTISNLPTGATVTWSSVTVDGYGALSVTSSTNSQATYELSEQGIVRVKATITTSCGIVEVLSDPVHVGMPCIISTDVHCEEGCLGGGDFLCTDPSPYDPHNNLFTYQLSTAPAYPITLNYMILDQYSNIFYQNSKTITGIGGYEYLPQTIPVGLYYVYIWVSGGPCNTSSEWTGVLVEVQSCGYSSRMVAYPNPSNTELRISYVAEKAGSTGTTKLVPLSDFNVKLLDKSGKVLKEGRTTANNKNIILQVADVPNGIYYLHIYEGKKVSKQQVVIFH